MRPDSELPADDGTPDGGVPSVVYNAPRLPRPAAEITAWTKARWGLYILVTFLMGMALTAADVGPGTDVAASVNPYIQARATGYARGQIIGGGIGAVVSTYMIAALLLAWSRRTRRFVPGTAFTLALVTSAGKLTSPDAAGSAGAQPGAFTANDPPSLETRARVDLAGQRARDDMEAHLRVVAARHGVDPAGAPPEWLSPAYIADARKHPRVHDYFTRYRQYLHEADSTSQTVFIDALRMRLWQESGLKRTEMDEILNAVREDLAREAPAMRLRSRNEHALITAALDLHAYLEGVDPRVDLDEAENVARFARDAERVRAIELAGEVEQWSAAVKSAQHPFSDATRP